MASYFDQILIGLFIPFRLLKITQSGKVAENISVLSNPKYCSSSVRLLNYNIRHAHHNSLFLDVPKCVPSVFSYKKKFNLDAQYMYHALETIPGCALALCQTRAKMTSGF